MPFRKAPKNLRDKLPKHAQEIYVKVFNNAYKQYENPKKRRSVKQSLDEIANKTAWAAVKKQYCKDESGKWYRKKTEK
ncbi:MAG: ChaB family protein [Candidatus Omnitrophota bacterium]|nr:MAG: ChaB family protein [Candidatus Omnitrophota bacterium]